MAVETSPIEAGVAPRDLDEIALNVIDFETKKCAGLSFLAGIPGGVALAGTVPADLAQYFAHVMRVEQKLAYSLWLADIPQIQRMRLNDEDAHESSSCSWALCWKLAAWRTALLSLQTDVAQKSIAKTIERQALTKTFFIRP